MRCLLQAVAHLWVLIGPHPFVLAEAGSMTVECKVTAAVGAGFGTLGPRVGAVLSSGPRSFSRDLLFQVSKTPKHEVYSGLPCYELVFLLLDRHLLRARLSPQFLELAGVILTKVHGLQYFHTSTYYFLKDQTNHEKNTAIYHSL